LEGEIKITSQPTIVLVHTQLDGFYQSLIWRGVAAAARLHGARLVSVMGKAIDSPIEDEAAHNAVFSLIAKFNPDALIASTNTLGNFCGPAAVSKWAALRFPDVPTISIGAPLPGATQVIVRRDGLGNLVNHLVIVHHCRKIAFIGGPANNPDAIVRLQEYTQTLEANGIEADPSLIEVADFMTSRVPAALDRILARHPDIDAVVAANDPMAITVCRELARRGHAVPRQIKVVGYDDIDEARHQAPSLTTIRAPVFQIAFHALELALGAVRRTHPVQTCFETRPIFRDSCGCLTSDHKDLRPDHHVIQSLTQRLLDPDLDDDSFLQDLMDCLGRATDGSHEEWAELLHQARSSIATHSPERLGKLGPVLEQSQKMLFQLAQGLHARAHFDLQGHIKLLLRHAQWILLENTHARIATRLNETLRLWNMHARLWILNPQTAGGAHVEWDLENFSHAWGLGAETPVALDPHESLLGDAAPDADAWVCLPLCTGQEQYGFILLRGEPPAETFFEGIRFMVTNALRAAHLLNREKRLSEELRDLSLRDPMTSLLNRRGFLEHGGKMESLAKRDGLTLGVLYADLDGLKRINDTWGHAEGDVAIETLGKALAASFRESDVVARLGGDEFAVLYAGESDSAVLQARMDAKLKEMSRTLNRPWGVEASFGWLTWNPRETPLVDALERADAMLYLTKKRRKLKLEENFQLNPRPDRNDAD
jgi:diguanylate cyclase (GGDEF)-like protein